MAGALVLTLVNHYVLRDPDLPAIGPGLFGALLVIVTLLRPHGLVPARAARARGS